MSVKVAQIDVFTDTAYQGAPAGVCLLDIVRPDSWMADVSREMACTNTAFLFVDPSDQSLNLRWFTAGGSEVPLCGHATLATAHLLYETGEIDLSEKVTFETQSGQLVVARRSDGSIEMAFPYEEAEEVAEIPAPLLEGIGQQPVWVGRNRLDYIILLENEQTLRALEPDLILLKEVECRGIIVTAKADDPEQSGYDYLVRFFGPRVGVPEDMVTGTAHCALAPFWRDQFSDNRHSFMAYQASPRGGYVDVRLTEENVVITGQAVTVLQGELLK